MPGSEQTASVEESAGAGSPARVRASLWVAGRPSRAWNPSDRPPGEGVRWFDVEHLVGPDVLLTLLAQHCPGLELEMLVDLLTPDEVPENRRWHEGEVRLASSFAVFPPGGEPTQWGKDEARPAAALYQAVELLAGDGWLITRWHDPRLYRGAKPQELRSGRIGKASLLAEVEKRWIAGKGRSAGALGVLAMHELALTYAPAQRHLRTAVETWELNLYGIDNEAHDAMLEHELELRSLWGARARLRDWLNQLNVPGLSRDRDRAWLPTEDHAEVRDVDDRVDDALKELSELGDTLRHAFQMMHIKVSEAQREHKEASQRQLEFMATVLLVPTLIVGFYGANTWVPGDHRHWGFWVMVFAMVVLTLIGVFVVRWLHGRRRSVLAQRREILD